MRDHHSRGRLVSALTATAAVIALASCTSSPMATHRTAKAVPTPISVAVPATIPNDPGLRADASMTSCSASKGGWGAAGRIVNSTGKAHDYRLTVLFTSDKATVIGLGTTDIKVPAGQTARWSIRAVFVTASPTLCVLSGVA